jgi:hypothetical protein
METNAAETEILKIVHARAEAVASGDPEASVANLSDDVVEFDLIDPLGSQGKSSPSCRTCCATMVAQCQ